jgi:hypothetical protein
MRHREGYVREDGMVFYRYLRGREHWVSAEQLQEIRAKRRAYRAQCQREYYAQQAKKDPMDRNYMGKYDFARNRYFAGVSSSGKERWLTKEQFDKYQEKRKANYTNYRKRLQQLPPTSFGIGDPHPENPELFVVRKTGQRCYWGDKKELQRHIEMRRRITRKKNQGLRYKRLAAFKNGRRKRGDVNEQGLIFWVYHPNMKEIWMTPEEFQASKEKERNRESKRSKGRLSKLPKERR